MRVDVSLGRLLNSREPLRGKPDLFRFGDLDRCCRQRAREQGQNGSDIGKPFPPLFGHHWPRFLLPCHPRKPRLSATCSGFTSNVARSVPAEELARRNILSKVCTFASGCIKGGGPYSVGVPLRLRRRSRRQRRCAAVGFLRRYSASNLHAQRRVPAPFRPCCGLAVELSCWTTSFSSVAVVKQNPALSLPKSGIGHLASCIALQ